MSDRELLELAAKAAGIPVHDLYDDIGDNGGVERNGWNPLTDDGDALRLAVKIACDIYIDASKGYVDVVTSSGIMPREWELSDGNRQTLQEATRRAIVRAAAETGEAMP